MLKNAGASVLVGKAHGAGLLVEIDGRQYLQKSPVSLASKRVFDIMAAAMGLILAAPLFMVIAVLIKLDSRGPVFFRQTRVGRYRKPFRMWKFRKMYHDMPAQGPSLTMRYDFRMTRFGRILERTKLDELPQLLNVLSGEMSAIGPRPEVPKFVEHHPERWDEVLSVKPGIFGANQIRNRNESELYPPGLNDVEGFYVDHILPDKLEIDAHYARQAGLFHDVWLLVRCLLAATLGVVTWRTVVTMRQQILNLLILSVAGVCGMAAAYLLTGRDLSSSLALDAILLASIAKPLALLALRIPKSLAMSVTADDFLRLVRCALISAVPIGLGMYCLGHGEIAGMVLVLDTALFLSALLIYKLALYAAYLTFRVQQNRVLVRWMVGASLLLAPLSLAMVIILRHGPKLWVSPDALYPSMLILASVVRPAIMLLMHAPARRENRIAEFFALQLHLVVATLVGSCLMILGSGLLGQRMIGRRDVLLDALIFHLMMTAVVLWQNARLARSAASSKEGSARSRERILVAGSGIELGMYVGALAALPERQFEIVGVLTPNDRYRTSTIGGHPVLGELLDLPQILKTLNVNRLVVAPHGIDPSSLTFMQNTAAETGCQYLAVPLLSGILSRGGCNGVANPRERTERASSYGLVPNGCAPTLRPNVT